MAFELIEDEVEPMELTEQHIERIERLLTSTIELQSRNIELQNRLCGIAQNCELHLHGINVGILAMANVTQGAFPKDLEDAMRHAATLRDRRRRK